MLSRTEVVGEAQPSRTLFERLDLDRNGRITVNEWQWSKASFDQRDADRNGHLDRAELTSPVQPHTNAYQKGVERGLFRRSQGGPRGQDAAESVGSRRATGAGTGRCGLHRQHGPSFRYKPVIETASRKDIVKDSGRVLDAPDPTAMVRSPRLRGLPAAMAALTIGVATLVAQAVTSVTWVSYQASCPILLEGVRLNAKATQFESVDLQNVSSEPVDEVTVGIVAGTNEVERVGR